MMHPAQQPRPADLATRRYQPSSVAIEYTPGLSVALNAVGRSLGFGMGDSPHDLTISIAVSTNRGFVSAVQRWSVLLAYKAFEGQQ